MSLIISYLFTFLFIIIYLIINYIYTFLLIVILVKGCVRSILCMISANSNLCSWCRWKIIHHLSTFLFIIMSLVINYLSTFFLIKILLEGVSVVFWLCLGPIVNFSGTDIDVLSTVVVCPSSCLRQDWTKYMDLWCDSISSSTSSWTDSLASSFSHPSLDNLSKICL